MGWGELVQIVPLQQACPAGRRLGPSGAVAPEGRRLIQQTSPQIFARSSPGHNAGRPSIGEAKLQP